MSTFSHLVHRVTHYLDPRTQIKATVHLARRAAYYANPVTQIRAVERAAHFTEREARKEYVKANRFTASIVQVVTPILAFVGSLIPVFGLIIGPVIAFLGAIVARISDSIALRSQGVTGRDNSRRARGKQNRTLKYGLFGSAVGGILSALGLGISAGAEVAGEAGAQGATGAAGVAGAPGAASAAPGLAATGAPSAFSGALEGVQLGNAIPSAATVGAGAGAEVGASAGFSAASGLAAGATAAGSGILGTGITWEQVGKVASPLLSVTQGVLKQLGIGQPKAAEAGQNTQYIGGGGGGAGAEGTGNTAAEGPLGEAMDALAGLPLLVKLGAAALGVGVVVTAFTKGKR